MFGGAAQPSLRLDIDEDLLTVAQLKAGAAGQREPAVRRGTQSNARDLGLERVDAHASGPGHVRTGTALAQGRVALLPGGAHDAR